MTLVLVCFLLSLPVCAWQGADPTRPLVPGQTAAAIKSKGDIVLQSIIRKQQAHKAVINGEVVSQGDSISGYRVVEIRPSSVLLKSAENQLELSLFSGAIFSSKELSSEELSGAEFSGEVKKQQ
ncbi:hypothetical protein [Thalassomonas actiniarum]|uniref:MSHA biogenesis protein MshK n=1 Tax=Thalassomonas actiniarum TaxID=485447 RepID=A0AAE9YP50_9GAMM|nr:hypothetical protein [Thalassomonas actiniarum]WDD98191.1 MSHA biogenesis protein MshK [Thalassomonas actiniarum]